MATTDPILILADEAIGRDLTQEAQRLIAASWIDETNEPARRTALGRIAADCRARAVKLEAISLRIQEYASTLKAPEKRAGVE